MSSTTSTEMPAPETGALPAGGAARKTLSHAFAQGGPATLSLALPGDALALDDERVLTVTVPREVRALVVDGANVLAVRAPVAEEHVRRGVAAWLGLLAACGAQLAH